MSPTHFYMHRESLTCYLKWLQLKSPLFIIYFLSYLNCQYRIPAELILQYAPTSQIYGNKQLYFKDRNALRKISYFKSCTHLPFNSLNNYFLNNSLVHTWQSARSLGYYNEHIHFLFVCLFVCCLKSSERQQKEEKKNRIQCDVCALSGSTWARL